MAATNERAALVVSDNSPLNVLIRIGEVRVLPELFNRVMVPPAVLAELSHPRAPQAVRDFAMSRPQWLEERVPRTILPLPRLDAGEREAVSLAVELQSPLLVDERVGRKEAQASDPAP